MSRANFGNADLLPDRIIGMMSAGDRKALGIRTDSEQASDLNAKNERALQVQCENYLRLHGFYFRHIPNNSRVWRGFPDLMIIIQGRALFVELKVEGGKVDDDQYAEMQRLRRSGCPVDVCWSFDQFIEAVKAFIERVRCDDKKI